jgi:hypothetical protein
VSKHLYWPHSEPEEKPPASLCAGWHPDNPPEVTVGRLCDDCYRKLSRYLTELPGLVAWLHANLAAGGTPLGERVSGSREAPTPLRLDVMDLIGPTSGDQIPDCDPDDRRGRNAAGEPSPSIADELASWVGTVTEERPDTTAPARLDVTSLCVWLQAQLPWIAAQAWVVEFMAALHEIERDTARVAPWRPELLRDRQEPCTDCGVLALVQHVAKGQVVCEQRLGGCGRSRAVTTYEWHTRHLRTGRGVAS